MKILVLGETRGQWAPLDDLDEPHDVVFHVGGLGLHSIRTDSQDPIPTPKLRHLTHFSPFGGQQLSQLDDYLDGKLQLKKPMYAIPSSIDDPEVITKFRTKSLSVPNLHIVDDLDPHYIQLDRGEMLVCGLPGMFSLHRLFHHSSTNSSFSEDVLPMSGDAGDVWLTVLHIGQFLDKMFKLSELDPQRYNAAIKVFLCNTPPFREPLLHHLSIMLKMDYTISAGLFFKHTASFNNLTAHSSLEGFKQGFVSQKAKLDRIISRVGPQYRTMLDPHSQYTHYLDLALETWDKIPTATAVSTTSSLAGSTRAEASSLVRNINDLYYTAFHHEWHLSISDPSHGFALLDINAGRVNISTRNVGFDFSYRFSQ